MFNYTTIYEELQQKGMFPYLISDLSNIYYTSGFTGSAGFIVIDENGLCFITDSRYSKQIETEISEDFEKKIVGSYTIFLDELSDKYKKIYLDPNSKLETYITLSKKTKVVVDVAGIITKLRMIKNSFEIVEIKNAYRIASNAFLDLLQGISFEQTENSWAGLLEYNMKKNGSRSPSFDTIIASGFRGALPHGVASDKIIHSGEPVVVDYGAKANYCSDITRMIYSGGDEFVLKIMDIVNDAKLKAIEFVKPGVKACEIDLIARKYLDGAGYGKYFNHGLGHGVGIDVHEKPSLNPHDDTILEPGMVLTIEPGLYFGDNFGVRIEDTILVNENGCEILSSVLDRHFYKIS